MNEERTGKCLQVEHICVGDLFYFHLYSMQVFIVHLVSVGFFFFSLFNLYLESLVIITCALCVRVNLYVILATH